MRRMILYALDLIVLDFGIVIGYYIRSIKDWFRTMYKEFEEATKKENDIFD